MAQLRGAIVVNVYPSNADETVQDYVEQLEAYIDAAGAELGTVVLSTVQTVPDAEVIVVEDKKPPDVDADSVPSDPGIEEVLMDPLDLIEKAESFEEARYV